MTELFIEGGRTLLGQEIGETSLKISGSIIADVGSAAHGRAAIVVRECGDACSICRLR
jgi:hypothetical protein